MSGDSISVAFYNDEGSQITDITYDGFNALIFDALTGRYKRVSAKTHTQPRYYELLLQGLLSTSASGTTIDMMDIWYTEGLSGEIE